MKYMETKFSIQFIHDDNAFCILLHGKTKCDNISYFYQFFPYTGYFDSISWQFDLHYNSDSSKSIPISFYKFIFRRKEHCKYHAIGFCTLH